MELSKKLQASGWHFTEEGIKTLTNALGNDSDPRKIIDEALNRDLRDIGGGALPTKREEGSGGTLRGRIVLQVQRVRNIAAPKSNEESKAAPRLLQLDLCDGQTSLQALELEPVPALSLNLAPGTKIYFQVEKLQLLHGFLLLRPNELQILGGRVEALYEKWDFARTMLKYARSGRPLSGSSSTPPPWVALGKSIVTDSVANAGNFKSLVPPGGDKDKPAKAENDEFNTMRNEAISAASKAGVKKVFGGGGQNIVDHNIKKILEKGFSKEEATTALQATRNNLERALYNLKRRKDMADGYIEPHMRGGRGDRGERPGREGKRGASLKDEAEAAKPAANATLFDFLTTKLRTTDSTAANVGTITTAGLTGESTKTTSTSAANPIARQHDSKASSNVNLTMGERTRFENNVSSSFAANRGGYSGRVPRGGGGGGRGARSQAGREERPSRGGGSSYNDRGGSGGGASMRRQDFNSRPSEQTHGRSANRNGQDNTATLKAVSEGKQENSATKEQGNNRRIGERQTNRNGTPRAENGSVTNNNQNQNQNNRRRQQGSGPNGPSAPVVFPTGRQQGSGPTGGPVVVPTGQKATNHNTHNIKTDDEFNNRLNKVVAETTNLKLSAPKREQRRGGRQSGVQSTRQPFENQAQANLVQVQTQKPSEKPHFPVQRQPKLQRENVRQQSNASNYTQLPNGYTYDPSKIMGFQSKETNEFAMSLLKSQGLAIAPPQNQSTTAQFPPATKQTFNLNSAPKVSAPKDLPPKVSAPKVSAPKVSAPKDLAPKDIAPKVSAFKVSAPKDPAPKVSAVTTPVALKPQPVELPPPPQQLAMNPGDAWMWNSADLCMAKYWDDGRYYEAEITAVSETTCVVLFLGYGNHEEVLKTDMLPITDSQNRPLTNTQSRYRGDRQTHQHQVYVPPHKREN